MFQSRVIIGALVLLGGAEALAQEVSLATGAAVSASATSNRDRLATDQANAAVFSTLVGTFGLDAHFPKADLGAEYRATILQPLLEAGVEGAETNVFEHDHALGANLTLQTTERMSLKFGLDAFVGIQTLRLLGATPSVLDEDDTLFEDGGVEATPDLIGARNRVFSLEASAGGGYRLSTEDSLFAQLSLGGRRDFAPEVLGQGELIAIADRDTVGYQLQGGWDKLLSPVLAGRLTVGIERTVFSQNLDTSQTWFAKAGARQQVSEWLAWSSTAGGSLTLAKETGAEGVQEDAFLPAMELAAALEVGSPTIGASVGYARGIVPSGVVGNTLLADAVNAEGFYRINQRIIARVRSGAALSRPAFEDQSLTDATTTLGLAGTVGVGLVDWLALDVSYTYEGQVGAAQSVALDGSVLNQEEVVVVHTFLVGLVARTALTPRGRRLKEEGGLLR